MHCHVEGARRTVCIDECVLDEDVGSEAELENEGVEVVGFQAREGVSEDEGEGEVVDGDAGSVHVGEEGGGEGGRVECQVSDDGVVGGRVRCGEAEQHGGGIACGVGGR